MSNELGFFGATTKIEVSDTAPAPEDRFTAEGPAVRKHRFMIVADADVFIERNGDADKDASSYIPAKVPFIIAMVGDDSLSAVTATSTANLYVTELNG